MTINELLKVDYRELNENAQYYFTVCDQGGLFCHFGNCQTVEEINTTADEIDAAEKVETLINAIKAFNNNPDALDNFESYLNRHFTKWCKKYAATPAGFISELQHFSEIEV